MTAAFDRPAEGRTREGTARVIGLDVSRAVALIGVVMMNYHGMINYSGNWEPSRSLIDRAFDIHTGILSTRFAATFVVVAGIGITLLTNSARSSDDRSVVLEARIRLARRGVVLVVAGYFLDMAWPGTILFYYGIYFLLAAAIFRFSSRVLIAIASVDVATTLAVSVWRRSRLLAGDAPTWISPADIDSPQDLFARAFLGYTHPVLPWMTFLIIGMVIGRNLPRLRPRRIGITLMGVLAATYVATSIVRSFDVDGHAVVYVMSSMQPDERGFAYIVSTACIAILAFVVISFVAEKCRSAKLVIALQRAGQLSLSLYFGHVLFHYLVVEWLGWGVGPGLGAAILFAVGYWAMAITVASWWHHRVGPGPAEWLYRRLGG